MARGIWLAVALSMVSVASAEAPVQSIRPQPRPLAAAAAIEVPTIRPLGRPVDLSAPASRPTVALAPEPTKPQATRKGSVCKNNDIKGTALKPITSRTKGCGVKAPVQVTSVGGVRLNPPATINCAAASALATWIDEGLQPAFQNQIVQLNIADSYSCRPRNNVRGTRISEHGSGNAIDIEGFVLNTGKTMTVASNYGKPIRAAQKAACGTFRTTLGPGSDGYHENHIHFDVSQRGGSPYCR